MEYLVLMSYFVVMCQIDHNLLILMAKCLQNCHWWTLITFHLYLPLVSNIFYDVGSFMFVDDTTLCWRLNANLTDRLLHHELSKICDCLGVKKFGLKILESNFYLYFY